MASHLRCDCKSWPQGCVVTSCIAAERCGAQGGHNGAAHTDLMPPQHDGLQLGFPSVQSESPGVNEKNQKKSQRSAATDMKKWEAGSPCRSVSWEWRWAAHQQVRNARPREAAEEELSIRLRCLPAPTVTDEVSAKANKLHMKWWLAGLNAAHSCLRWNSSGLLCWQATADICEQVTQFSLPAACPGLSSGLFIKLPSPYQKEKVKKKRRKCFIRTISLLWDWGTLQLILFLKCNSFIRDL